jgi:hypothetical protein
MNFFRDYTVHWNHDEYAMIVFRVRKQFSTSFPNIMRSEIDEQAKQTVIQSLLYIVATLIPILLAQALRNENRNHDLLLGY